MDYVVWNPLPWSLFALGILVCVVSVKWFHQKYPGFPNSQLSVELPAKEIMIPLNRKWEGALPRCRVSENTSVAVIKELLANGVLAVGVENSDGELIGSIGPKQVPTTAPVPVSTEIKIKQQSSAIYSGRR